MYFVWMRRTEVGKRVNRRITLELTTNEVSPTVSPMESVGSLGCTRLTHSSICALLWFTVGVPLLDTLKTGSDGDSPNCTHT